MPTLETKPRYKPLANYGLIGNMRTVALVGIDGAIDFMCFPHFDSPSIFAALLDHDRGGFFQIAPVMEGAENRQLYLPDTNILLTRFLARDGVAELSDFMHIGGNSDVLVRRAKTVRGELGFRMTCAPKLDYGRAKQNVTLVPGGAVFESQGVERTVLRLRTPVPFELVDGAATCEFVLRAGETAPFVLERVAPGAGDSACDSPAFVARSFKETMNYWRHWIAGATYEGRWREVVHRSALVLKMMTSRTYGSMVASPTFGLPEVIGGTRNWDYRYTWIRDASFTLYAFLRLGFTEEAAAFMGWIEKRCLELKPDGSLRTLYALDGRHQVPEQIIPFEGYMGSSPVRIGNNAYEHLQLDISGELMDAIYIYNTYAGDPVHHDLWIQLVRLVNWVCVNWRRKDEGIWEVRGGPQEFIYSRLMCWAAIDRAIRLARKRSFPGPLAYWHDVRDEIYTKFSRRSGTPSARSSRSAKAREASTRRSCSCRWSSSSAPPTRAGYPRFASSGKTCSMTPWSIATRSRRPPMGCLAKRAPFRCARSGTSSAYRAPATSRRRGSISRRCSAMRTTSGSTPRSSGRAANISEIFRRRSRISLSSVPPTTSTDASRRSVEPSKCLDLP